MIRQHRPFYLLLALLLGLAGSIIAQAQEWIYTVRPGDTIWDISHRYLAQPQRWRQLQRYNAVARDREIPPGSRLRIPVQWLKRQPAPAYLKSYRGPVQLRVNGQRRTPTPGMRLTSGSILFTGEQGTLEVEFLDGSTLQLQPNGQLYLDDVNTFGDSGFAETQLRLLRGRIETEVRPRGSNDHLFEIITPSASSSVRGTQLRIGVEEEAATTTAKTAVEVTEGEVLVTNARTQRTLTEGFGLVAIGGEALPTPVPLLPAPAMAPFNDRYQQLPLAIALPNAAAGVGYRVLIYAGEALLFSATGPAASQLTGPSLPDGRYRLLARAIDADGLEGLEGEKPIIVNAQPEAPFLLAPSDGAVVAEATVTLRWSESQTATDYTLQLAADPEFRQLIATQQGITGDSATLPFEWAPGSYYWRVAGNDAEGLGPYSLSRSLRRPEPSPNLDEAQTDKGELVLRWGEESATGVSYRVQLARSSRFDDPIVDQTVTSPALTLAAPPSGYYYIRLQRIAPDGVVSPFGAPQRLTIPPQSYWPMAIPPLLLLLFLL